VSLLLVDGCRYEVRGAGTGPAILFLHGFTGRGAEWAPVAASLRRHVPVRTIVIDLLGHGRSDAPADPARHALDRQAGDIAAILRELGAAPAAVVGYSFGARIALRLAVDHPTAVRSLVLESPSAGIPDADARARRRQEDRTLADSIERDGIEAFVDTWWETVPVFASERRLPATTRARLRADRLRNRPDGLAGSLRDAGQGAMTPLHDRLSGIGVPVLVIAGSLDETGAARARAVAGAIPGARLEILDDAGHAAHRESARRFRRLVIEFLQEVPAA
jgi:2-succinyl-6-hydroxy-2,4-cyclohexadiene-1-carboxylate synthase